MVGARKGEHASTGAQQEGGISPLLTFVVVAEPLAGVQMA